MEGTHKVNFQYLKNKGFTLIEVLMVIITLSILAVIVVPQFNGSSEDARKAALSANLATICRTLEIYALQHNEEYPNAGDSDTFIKQLTHYTNKRHLISDKKTEVYRYGPYIRGKFPKNPFAKNEFIAGKVSIDTIEASLGVFNIDPNKSGWFYKTKTGEFIDNTPKEVVKKEITSLKLIEPPTIPPKPGY